MVVGGLKMEVGFHDRRPDGDDDVRGDLCLADGAPLHHRLHAWRRGYNRFFSYISLFTFSMLMLVMSNNLLQLFFGWEAVGLVSYLLIGFWFNKPTAIFANMKAFLVNRVGDFGFILGIGLIAAYAGTLNYTECLPRLELADLGVSGHRLDADHRDLHLPVHWRHGQVGPVPAACVAARFDGRPDADFGADPRGHHGHGGHLHGLAHVAAV
jgi:hypothetical protein